MDLLRSERILDKLKLLNYNKKFLPKYKSLGIRALNRHHFAVDKVKSSVSQFYTFACICTWLLKICNSPIENPDENDDPLDILENIVSEAMALGIKGLDFPVANLRTGFGEHCLFLLESVSEEALKQKRFDWKGMDYPEEDPANEAPISRSKSTLQRDAKVSDDEDDNDSIDDIDDQVAKKSSKNNKRKDFLMREQVDYFENSHSETESDYEDNNALSLDNMLSQQQKINQKGARKSKKRGTGDSSGIITDTDGHLEWLEEVERVAPNLKVVARLESKDWRARIDQISSHQATVETALETTKPKLERLENDLGKSLDTVSSREKYLNSNLENLISQLRTAQDNLMAKENAYESVSGGISSKSEEFNLLTNRLDNVKKTMEERGTSMTDGTPVVKLKQSLNRLHAEIQDMTLQNAVLEHQLTQMRMHKKSTLARDVNINQNSVMV